MTAIASYDTTHETAPTWVEIDDWLVEWESERGRRSEFDKTEAGTAQLTMVEREGNFDPTYGSSLIPYPLAQAKIEVVHPIALTTHTVFTGYTEEYKYKRIGPRGGETIIPLTDGFEILNQAHGSTTAKGTYYAAQHVDDRIYAALADALWPAGRTRIASGNVNVQGLTYDASTALLEIIQEAADAEFPGVANFFMDKDGNAAFNGRGIRFDPTSYPLWVTWWRVGDEEACAIDPTLLPIVKDGLTLSYGKDTIYNDIVAAPRGVSYAAINGNHRKNTSSIGQYGLRSLSLLDLLTLDGSLTGQSGVRECRDFADYYKNNYADPQVRVSSIEFHGQMDDVGGPLGGALWDFILGVEITHIVEVNTVHPGGGGLSAVEFYVEGIRNHVSNLNDVMPNWTMELDLSPRALYASYP